MFLKTNLGYLSQIALENMQLLIQSVSKLFENVKWSNSLLRHFKIHTLLKINCCMAAISAFRVTQHSQIFSLFFRNRIQCIALYQLHNSQALPNLRRGYFSSQNLALIPKYTFGVNVLKSTSLSNDQNMIENMILTSCSDKSYFVAS